MQPKYSDPISERSENHYEWSLITTLKINNVTTEAANMTSNDEIIFRKTYSRLITSHIAKTAIKVTAMTIIAKTYDVNVFAFKLITI